MYLEEDHFKLHFEAKATDRVIEGIICDLNKEELTRFIQDLQVFEKELKRHCKNEVKKEASS